MAGLVHEGKDVSSLSMSNQIDGGRLLVDLPEMGVVKTEDPAEKHFIDDPVGNKKGCFSGMEADDLLEGSHGPEADLIQSLASRYINKVGFLYPLSVTLGVPLLNLLKGAAFPRSKAHVYNPRKRLDFQAKNAGDFFGRLPCP